LGKAYIFGQVTKCGRREQLPEMPCDLNNPIVVAGILLPQRIGKVADPMRSDLSESKGNRQAMIQTSVR
jgi:hypothetical protein